MQKKKVKKTCSIYNSTFETLVSGLALRTKLSPLPSFILIARPAHRKTTLVACHKQISIHSESNIITTYLTHLTVQVLQRLVLHQNNTIKLLTYENKQTNKEASLATHLWLSVYYYLFMAMNDNKLVPVVRTSD